MNKNILNQLYLIVSLFLCLLFLQSYVSAASNQDRVDLYVLPGCSACHQAEEELYQAHIVYNEKELKPGMQVAPELYINRHLYGIGTQAVQQYIKERKTI